MASKEIINVGPIGPKNKNQNKSKKKKKAGKKVKKGIKQQYGKSVNRMLAAMNPYLNTVLNPFEVQGVRIPDLICFPSVCFSTVDRGTTAVTAGGTFGVFYMVGTLNACVQLNTAASTSPALTWAAATGLSAFTTINSTYDRVRPVSAGLAVKYMGTPLSAQGRFIISFLPGNTGATLPGTSVNAILARPYTQTKLASSAYSQVLYFPLDPNCYVYQAPTGAWSYGNLVIVGDGMTAAATVEYTIVVNWEATPQLSSLSLTRPEVSRSDPIELAHASNIISNTVPTIQPEKVKPADNIATTGNLSLDVDDGFHAQQQKTGGGFLSTMLNGVIDALDSDTGKSIMGVVGKVAPAVAAFL